MAQTNVESIHKCNRDKGMYFSYLTLTLHNFMQCTHHASRVTILSSRYIVYTYYSGNTCKYISISHCRHLLPAPEKLTCSTSILFSEPFFGFFHFSLAVWPLLPPRRFNAWNQHCQYNWYGCPITSYGRIVHVHCTSTIKYTNTTLDHMKYTNTTLDHM